MTLLQSLLSKHEYYQLQTVKLERKAKSSNPAWGADFVYTNSETGRVYKPHSDEERRFVYEYTVPFPAIIGGERGGKTVAGTIADLERVRNGMSGIAVGPNLPHFRRSLWPEFRRWCPWQFVVESQRYRASPEWTPHEQFELVFDLPGYPRLLMGGLVGEGGRPGTWEGPTVSFFHIDEARHLPGVAGLKVLAGRTSAPGPTGWQPQGYITSTGGCDWITEYYGPLKEDDAQASFKAKTQVIILPTEGNLDNLSSNYLDNRSSILTDAEREVLLGNDPWSVIVDSPFLDNMILWDRLKEDLPILGKREPLVIALDAGAKRDHFGMVGVTRHPVRARHEDCAIRFAEEWIPQGKRGLDFSAGPLLRLRELKRAGYYIACVVYDPWQLHQPMLDVERELGLYVKEFTQGDKRTIADSDLLSGIMGGNVAHDGNPVLRKHIQNSRRKPDPSASGRIRLVKQSQGEKIDLSVCTSMGVYYCKLLSL